MHSTRAASWMIVLVFATGASLASGEAVARRLDRTPDASIGRAPASVHGGARLSSGSTSAAILTDGARLSVAGTEATLSLARLGREAGHGALVGLRGEPRVEGALVSTDCGPDVHEWWRALPTGLEHGVTIDRRPDGRGTLVLELTLSGGLHAADLDERSVALLDGRDRRVGRYAGLTVIDATGSRVPSRMIADAGSIRIEVRDSGATYPIVVDPLVTAEEATLVASDAGRNDIFGFSTIALSGDGSRALVGMSYDDTADGPDAGSARVLLRTGTTWTEEATLTAPGTGSFSFFGVSVALSSDASRAVVGTRRGDPSAGSMAGTLRVFVRAGTSWTQEAVLVTGSTGANWLGYAVSMTADGTRILVGTPFDDLAGGGAGCARVYVRSGSSWAMEATLVPIGGVSGDQFGTSVSISADGSRALVGAPYQASPFGNVAAGRARVFVRAGATWIEEATLDPGFLNSNSFFGSSVALSGDGTVAVVGAPYDDYALSSDCGTVRVFSLSGGMWDGGTRLVAGDAGSDDQLGTSVAVSSDGTRIVAGAPRDDHAGGTDAGSARTFLFAGGTWTEEPTLLPSSAGAFDTFGTCVALSADGGRAAVSAPAYDITSGGDEGAAYVFTIDATRALGAACPSPAHCTSGFCVDGVCCNTACGGGATRDCEACALAAGAGADGTCVIVPAGTVCYAAIDLCDVDETCDGATTACPTDQLAAAGTECRPVADVCDVAEACSGTSAACPATDGFLSGVECRASAGACDAPELCFGSAATCPPDVVQPAAMACRISVDPFCDPAEVCDGTSTMCPADVTTCGTDGGPRTDAGPPVDGGAPSPGAVAGCSCRGGARPPGVASALAAVALSLASMRRRRR